MERTALNFLGRLIGVATLTAAFVAETAGTRARIAATRKTTPGLRALEKQAVVHGGGLPHRFGLFDAAMVKDNHIRAAGGADGRRASGAGAAGPRAPPRGGGRVARPGPRRRSTVVRRSSCWTTWTSEQVREAVRLVGGRAARRGLRRRQPARRVRDLAGAGVDVISVGALTTAAQWVDIGLDME